MNFDTTTFLFEIANFLILLWILQRLFYRPLLDMIAQRKQYIDQTLSDAQTLKQQADEQCLLYQNRLTEWEQEKQVAREALQQQLNVERAKQLEQLKDEFELEQQKYRVHLARKQQKFMRQAEQQALTNAAKFAAILLQQASGPELEARLFDYLLSALSGLPEECRSCLQYADRQTHMTIKVSSAYMLNDEQRQRLEQCLALQFQIPLSFEYQCDRSLIAGLKLDIGAWALNANLQHELVGLADLAYDQN